MKTLSIIIVSYNVRYFLQQTLVAVKAAIKERSNFQVVVVDNNSSDDSCSMVSTLFPEVKLIANSQNLGFSKANNIGINAVESDFVLLLNPDTLIAEDTLDICLDFMTNHADCGAIGVKMIDGNGEFLPESKRGLPTPLTSFYKIFGLSSLFPKSPVFGKYHLKYLDLNQNHSIEILSGAFMFMRRKALVKAGLLDEQFFMYGEDIDLSYRILKAGYKNYYLSSTCIIHYKGESTKKHSLKYVKVFYEAMFIFFRKHFAVKTGWFYSAFIRAAVALRAVFSGLKRMILLLRGPATDFILSYSVYYAIARYWEEYNKWVEGGAYPSEYYTVHLPLYSAFLVCALFLSGAYQSFTFSKTFKKGVLWGILGLVIVYALLPEPYRYSRAILMLGAILSAVAFFFVRTAISLFSNNKFQYNSANSQKKILFIGHSQDMEITLTLFNQNGYYIDSSQCIRVDPKVLLQKEGFAQKLEPYVAFYKPLQIIFSLQSTPCKSVITGIHAMRLWGPTSLILNPSGHFLIGSEGKNKPGIVITKQKPGALNNFNKNHLYKRVFDLVFCLLWPLIFYKFSSKIRQQLKQNTRRVLTNHCTWFWVQNQGKSDLKQGVFNLCELYPSVPCDQLFEHYDAMFFFAREWNHVRRLFKSRK